MAATGGGTGSSFDIVVAAAILAGLFVVLAIAIIPILRRLKNRRLQELLRRLGEDRVVLFEPAVNFFGQTSLGLGQIRGQGCLAFTAGEVFFLMWLPRREFRVPISAIRSIETPRSHLGKTKVSPLLKITFADPRGGED